MMEGDDGPARRDKSDGIHKPSHRVEGLGIMACWKLFKRGVRGASSHPSPTCPPSTLLTRRVEDTSLKSPPNQYGVIAGSRVSHEHSALADTRHVGGGRRGPGVRPARHSPRARYLSRIPRRLLDRCPAAATCGHDALCRTLHHRILVLSQRVQKFTAYTLPDCSLLSRHYSNLPMQS